MTKDYKLKKTPRKLVPAPQLAANQPADFDPADVAAIQHLMAGDATPEQQRRGMEWIINKASRAFDNTWFSGNQHDSSFLAGRAFVGQQILGVNKINLSFLLKDIGE